MMRESFKLKRVLVSIMVVLMMAAYMPGMAFAEEGGGGQPSIAEADWNFDAATGTLNGFKDGKNFNNPTTLNIPKEIGGVQVKKLGEKAFTYAKETGSHLRRVKNRITAVNFPEGLEDTGTWAFQGNDLSEVKIPSSVKTIGERTFCGNRNLEKIKFEAPSVVSELGSSVFEACNKLERIDLPEGIKKIGVRAFNSTKFKTMELPESLEEIGGQAFSLSGVQEITIPENVTKINLDERGKEDNGLFFRTFGDDLSFTADYGTAKGTLTFTRVHDKSGKANATNTRGVVNPQKVTINFVDESGEKIKEPIEATGFEKNAIRKKGYSTEIYDGDGHYYTDYKNPWKDSLATASYLKDNPEKLIGENYYSSGKEYVFTAPELEGYTKPAQPVTKTISAADHTVTFTYKGEAKPEFDFEGEGLTASVEKGEVDKGKKIDLTVHEPAGKKLKSLTVGDEDVTAKATFDGIDYHYSFKIEKNTKVKVEYDTVEVENTLSVTAEKSELKVGNGTDFTVKYRGKEVTLPNDAVEVKVEGEKKTEVSGNNFFPYESGEFKVNVASKAYPELKDSFTVKVDAIDVTVRLEDCNNTVLPKTKVTLDKIYLEKGKTYYNDFVFKGAAPIVAIEKALREKLNVNTASKDEFDCSSNGNWMKLLGKDLWKNINADGSYMVGINNKMAKKGVGEAKIEDGDSVLVYYDDAWMTEERISYFDKEEYETTAGKDMELSLTKSVVERDQSWNIIAYHEEPVKDVTLEVNGKEVPEVVFDDRGKATYKFDEPGEYRISAVNKGESHIVRPYAIVKVTEDLDKKAAEAVKRQIEELPAVDDLKLDDENKVTEARAAYDALNDEQKSIVGDEAKSKLETAEKKIAELKKAKEEADKKAKEEKEAADKKAKEAKEEAEKKAKEEQKAKADKAAAEAVEKLIAALKGDGKDKKDVEAARKAYDALTKDQQKLIKDYNKLTKAEEKVNESEKLFSSAKNLKVKGFKVKRAKGRKFKFTWKKTKGAAGYVVMVKKPGSKKYTAFKTLPKGKKVKFTGKKLKKGKKYTFRICAYSKVAGEKVLGVWKKSKKLICR